MANDVQAVHNKLQAEVEERRVACDQILAISQNAEKICNRLADDSLRNCDDLRQKMDRIKLQKAEPGDS